MPSMTERRTKNQRVPTSLRFPLDTENASTFIKFTSVKHSKIVSGVSAAGHREMQKVKMAHQTATNGPAGQTEGDFKEAALDAGSDVIGAVGSKLTEWAGAALTAVAGKTATAAYHAAANNIDTPDRLVETLGNTVEIFMPQSIQINDSATYDNTALGTAGRRIGAIASNGQLPGVNEALAGCRFCCRKLCTAC